MMPRHLLRPIPPSAALSSGSLHGILVIAVIFGACATRSFAQDAPPLAPAPGTPAPATVRVPAPLAPEIRTATPAGPFKAQINKFIVDCLHAIEKGIPKDQGAARDAIKLEMTEDAKNVRSAAFKSLFATELNAELLKPGSAAINPDARVRLNVAIAVVRTAQASKGGELEPVATLLLQDKNEAVLIWAMKVAGAVLPSQLQAQAANVGKTQLHMAVTTAATRSRSGQVALNAYDALSVPVAAIPQAQRTVVAAAAVGEIQKLLAARTAMYGGATPIQDPQSDSAGTLYLTTKSTWDLFPPPGGQGISSTNKASLKVIQDLATAAAEDFAKIPTPTAEQANDYTGIVASSAKALYVAMINTGNKTGQNDLTPATNINASTPAATVVQLSKDMAAALKKAGF